MDKEGFEENMKRKKLGQLKKLAVTITVIMSILLITAGLVLYDRIQTIRSITHVQGDFYNVEYQADYKLDEVLAVGARNVKELEQVLSEKMFFGYPIETNENLYGCSAFAARTLEGKHIVGRNFDYAKAGALLVYTAPKEGYSSYSTVSLTHLGVSEAEGTMPETLISRHALSFAHFG